VHARTAVFAAARLGEAENRNPLPPLDLLGAILVKVRAVDVDDVRAGYSPLCPPSGPSAVRFTPMLLSTLSAKWSFKWLIRSVPSDTPRWLPRRAVIGASGFARNGPKPQGSLKSRRVMITAGGVADLRRRVVLPGPAISWNSKRVNDVQDGWRPAMRSCLSHGESVIRGLFGAPSRSGA